MPGLSYEKGGLFKAKSQFLQRLKDVNAFLEGKDWLVGTECTVADVSLLNASYTYLTFFSGDKERKSLSNLVAWLERFSKLSAFQKWYGKLRLVSNAQTWFKTEAGDAVAKKPQQKKQKKPEQKKVAKKPKYEFPETEFDLFNFKTFYVNEKDTAKANAELWKQYDPKGWSMYHLKYIKYEGECEEVYKTNNLLGGFLARCVHLGKYLFGTHLIAGDEPNLVIEAVWIVRGTEIFPELKEHDQFDTYEWIKLDSEKEADRKLAEEFLTTRKSDIDVKKVNGNTVRSFNWIK